jgi:hypothetical protein
MGWRAYKTLVGRQLELGCIKETPASLSCHHVSHVPCYLVLNTHIECKYVLHVLRFMRTVENENMGEVCGVMPKTAQEVVQSYN